MSSPNFRFCSRLAREALGARPYDLDTVLDIEEKYLHSSSYPTDLRAHLDGYVFITTQWVTLDFSNIDLLKLAALLKQFPYELIVKLATQVKSRAALTIPYLAGCLERESAEAVEEIRREARYDALVRMTAMDEPAPTQVFPTATAQLWAQASSEIAIEEVLRAAQDQ